VVGQKRNRALMLDQASLPWFVALNGSMLDGLDRPALRQRLLDSAHRLRELATEILDRGSAQFPQLDGSALRAAIAAAGGPVRSPTPLLFAALAEEAVEA
jgi:hypothetical protein